LSCRNENVDKENILNRIETSFKAEGFSLVNKGKQSSDELERVYPYKYTLKLNDQNEDYILIYIYNSKDACSKAIKNQHYTITSLTNFENFNKDNL
jgi:hypothetical protein